jgi:hypothetical protein
MRSFGAALLGASAGISLCRRLAAECRQPVGGCARIESREARALFRCCGRCMRPGFGVPGVVFGAPEL